MTWGEAVFCAAMAVILAMCVFVIMFNVAKVVVDAILPLVL